MPNIPEIKIGNTTYKLKDTELRNSVDDLKSVLNTSLVLTTIPIDSSMVMDGFIYGTSGTYSSSDSYKCTDYVDISGYVTGSNIDLFCSLYSNAGIAFYNANKKYINGYSGSSLPSGDSAGTKTRRLQIPNGTKYVRTTLRVSDYSSPSDFVIRLSKVLSDVLDYGGYELTIPAASLKPLAINDNTGIETVVQSDNRATSDFIPAPRGTVISSIRGFWVYLYDWETLEYRGVYLSTLVTTFTSSSDVVVKINENITNTTAESITVLYPNRLKTSVIYDNTFFNTFNKNIIKEITESKSLVIPKTDLVLGDLDNSGNLIPSTTRSVTDYILVSKGDIVTCDTKLWCFEYDYNFVLSVNLNLLRNKYVATSDCYIRIVQQSVPDSANDILITRNNILRYAKDSEESFKRTKKYVGEQIADLTTQRAQSIRAASDDFLTRWLPYSVGNSSYSEGIISGNMYERLNIAWSADPHITSSNGVYTAQNVREMVDFVNSTQNYKTDQDVKSAIKAIIDCGDAFTPRGINTKAYSKSMISKYFNIVKGSNVPVLWSKGNHDCNDWDNYPSNVFDDADWSEIWLDWAEEEYGIVRQLKANGEKSTWHYIDFDDFKVRVIVADAQDVDKTKTNTSGYTLYDGVVAWGISQEQMEWFENTALDFDDKDDKDWGVIIALHQSIHGDQSGTPHPWGCLVEPAYESSIGKLVDLVKAFNEQTTYAVEYTFTDNHFYDLDIDADFTRYANATKKPHVICWLMGHWHIDKYQVWKGMNFIWTNSMSCLVTQSNPALLRTPNTIMQNSFDILNIDTKQRKIRIFKYGAGKDCYGNGGDRFIPDGLSY